MTTDKIWHLYIIKDLDPIRVQAIYHALALSIAKTPKINVLLLTTINKSSICCGFHQNFYEEVDIDYCKKNDIELVRRMAGGGLVLLEKDQVFYNVILNGMGFPAPMRHLYKISLKGPNHFLHQNKLNSIINYNEILIRGRKISGIGAASIENAGIVIGNILLDFNFEKFSQALNVPNEHFRKMVLERTQRYMTTIKKEKGVMITNDEAINGLKSAFEEKLKTKLIEKELGDHEFKFINEVEDEYKDSSWNFRKKNQKNNKRSYIKIKNGVFVYYNRKFNANFLVVNGSIRRVHAQTKVPHIHDLLGVNIFKISKKFPELKKLENRLKHYCNRTIS